MAAAGLPSKETSCVASSRARLISATSSSAISVSGLSRGANVNYKHMLEVWLETLRYEHLKELERSPLERGAVLGENRRLDTCFTPGDGALVVGETSRSVTPLVPVDFRPVVDRVISDEVLANDVRGRAQQTITHWNAVEAELNRTLSNLDDIPEEGGVLDDDRVVDVLISRWAKIPPDDPRNVDLEQAAAALGLGNELKVKLAKAGVQDLRDVAGALRAAPKVEAHNRDIERLKEEIDAADCDATTRRLFTVTLPDRIDDALGGSDAEALRGSIDRSLRGGYDGPSNAPAPKKKAKKKTRKNAKKKTKKKPGAKKKRQQ